MNESENIHSGHRKRMLEKAVNAPESLADHEILEVLLFYVLPRRDTNALAHRLIRAFGGIDKVFRASAKELKTVDGVGDKVAEYITVNGRLLGVIGDRKADKRESWLSFADSKAAILRKFVGMREEMFVMFLLDAKRRVIMELSFEDKNRNNVSADIPEIAKAFALHKPSFAVVAHNHPSCNPLPSAADDMSTKKINILCEMHGVTLLDHVIVAGENTYSYFAENRLSGIKEVADLDKLLTGIKE